MARGDHSSIYFDSDTLSIIDALKEQLGDKFKLSTYVCDLIKKDNQDAKGSLESKEKSIIKTYTDGRVKS